MKINKLSTTIEEQTERERAQAITAHNKAVQDYNVMMGILEDPSEEDEEDERTF